MVDIFDNVRAIVGESYSDKQIENGLEKCDWHTEQTIAHLLGVCHHRTSCAASRSIQANRTNAAANLD